MDIDTSTKDAIDAPLGSNGSKGSFGSDDSLEYSNDDRSTTKATAAEHAKPSDKYLPPKHPSSVASIGDQYDSNLFTPKRKQYFEANADRLPGPLNLFSPGLSPIGHTNYSRYDEGDDNHDILESHSAIIEKRPEVETRGAYDTDLRDSVDSLDMVSLKDDENKSRNSLQRDIKEDNRPNYQFWKNKLFSNDLAPIDITERVSSPVIQSIVFPPAECPQQRSFIRSNSNSFDSDFNLTPRQHSLVYPTTDALYERSAVVHSPHGAADKSVSMDSSSIQTRTVPGQQQQQLEQQQQRHHQFVMYPVAGSLEARSPHSRRVDSSTDNVDGHLTMQSLMSPDTPIRSEESSHRYHQLRLQKQEHMLNSPGSANGSLDSDLHVTKQSLVYPTTRAVYEKSARPIDDISVDSDMRAISKQSLVYPTTAALFRRSGGGGSLNTTIDTEVSFAHQSYLHPTAHPAPRTDPSPPAVVTTTAAVGMVVEDCGEVGKSLGHISMLDHSLPSRSTDGYKSPSGTRDEEGEGEGYSYGHSLQYEYAEEDALGQSLHSISLLPGSPQVPYPSSSSSVHVVRIPTIGSSQSNGSKRTSNLLFPPSYPHNGSPPTSARGKAPPLMASTQESTTFSNRRKTQASNSDTEFVRSATKRRDIGNEKTGNVWREAEDLAPSNFTSLWNNRARNVSPQQPAAPVASAAPVAARHMSPPPSALSSPSSVSGGSPFAGRMYTHDGVSAGGGIQMEGSLVVGALYTLQVDSHGRPAFVPVMLNAAHSGNAAGVTFSSPQVHATKGATPPERKMGYHTFSAIPQQMQEVSHFTSPPSSRKHYRGPAAHTDTLGLSTDVNSNHVDVHMVLERALHHGSLSEEKLARRWSGDTTKRNSPPAAVAPTPTPALALGQQGLSYGSHHPHQQQHQNISPTTPLRSGAPFAASHATPGTSTSGYKPTKKSPYRFVVGADGQEHLQPSAEYYKERLLRRSLTSVLPSPATATGGGGNVAALLTGPFGRLQYSPPISSYT